MDYETLSERLSEVFSEAIEARNRANNAITFLQNLKADLLKLEVQRLETKTSK